MLRFDDRSISSKLVLTTVTATAAALLLSYVVTLGFGLWRYRDTVLQSLSLDAAVVGENCAAAILFHDPQAAQEQLAALRKNHKILGASIYLTDGSLFASDNEGLGIPMLAGASQRETFRFERDELALCQPIRNAGESLGSLCIHAQFGIEWTLLRQHAALSGLAMLVALVISVFLAMRLQRALMRPLQAVAETMRGVTEEGNYARRAEPYPYHDEIGNLVTGFNQMLDEIHKRDAEIHRRESQLQSILDHSPSVIYLKNPAGQYLLVNRRYEQLFHRANAAVAGKTDHDFWPRSVADALCANDQKVLASRRPVEFEERVPQDDGLHTYISVKFPLATAEGSAFAVCGISTDITERRRLERQVQEISNRELSRIGQELHDGLCQDLVSTAFAANLLQRSLVAQASPEAVPAQAVADLIDHAITHARDFARGLYPVRLEGDGLAAALQDLAVSLGSRFKTDGVVCNAAPVFISEHIVASNLYRIAQEAATNALKHGQSAQVVIELRENEGLITLQVRDDGVGLREGWEQARGMGIHLMRYRASLIGASFEIGQATDRGTSVICQWNVVDKAT